MLARVKSCPQCAAPGEEADRFCSACGHNLERDDPSSPGDPLVGRTIAGGYLIQELIGVGGMGRVYKGVQNMLGRTVAVKVIHPHLLGDEQTVARFYNEARAASRLNHPESVGIIDFGRTDDGILYLVMEYLAGKDLATVLAEEGPLPFKRICRILRKVLAALGEAHALGVVHRDLKPENIIVQKGRKGDEVVKVVDFGLATIVGPGSSSITSPGLVCGTPDYMSPEQGRGDELDGRSDLYSMGVLLFEMLTDRLPFTDDTPTKVVLRHIHDPVPDPRVVAPQRRIPDQLAELTMRSLAKAPSKRFQSADEMDDAVRRAEESLETRHVSMIECPTCGHLNPMTVRFCGECGTRLTGIVTIPPGARPERAVTQSPPVSAPARGSVQPATRRPLVGRDAELAQLANLRQLVIERPVWMRVLGEAGVGKTRLLSELALLASGSGDQVVMAGPHPSGAPAPYFAVRTLIAGLLDVDESRLPELATGGLISDPLARAGIAEIVDSKGLPGLPGVPRAGAVAAALAAAVRVAGSRARSGIVVLVIDDLTRCDTLSRLALTRLVDIVAPTPTLIVTSGAATREPSPHPQAMSLVLRGLDNEEAQDFLNGTVSAPRPVSRERSTEPTQRLLLPLYLEQVRALGKDGHDETLPPRLADAVMARLERLDLPSRRLLQAVSVLGDSCPIDWLREVAQAGDLAAIETLTRLGLLFTIADRVEVVHPFVRDLVEASIPAEARKELHARALQVAAGNGAVLEVRAEHAFKAGEPMSALLLLERMGDAAMLRGDAMAATLAFRRGLDLARRELLLSGDLSLDRALVTFSRKLGEALEAHGDLAGADGVLREALELAGPRNKERARMLLVLGRVAIKRERRRDAQRLLGQAIESATANDDPRCEAEVQLNLARLRREEGDAVAAANTFRKACELLASDKSADRESALASSQLEYAETLVEIGDADLATEHLEAALRHARASGASAIAARATGVLGTLRELAGELAKAASLYLDAAGLAQEAGDAEAAARWNAAASAA
ncbi:serine/threonine protein kinase [Sandaracinus amylolyticus]|uniref:non-specific serine/threonine protein kinase n=1 Tax=Sandaracinus amylolyticus TaxID=927083 RepID=A0A0F6YI33_9BACT|nr:serine/threonine protein kinase [Sandaracinus amylolyticus]